MTGVLAYVTPFAGNFAPTGWALCYGQLLPISQNTALFSLLGTYYGGDGKTTFALPDLRGRTIVGAGQGVGLSIYDLGQSGGTETTTLISTQLPVHSHPVQLGYTPKCSSSNGNTTGPGGSAYAPLSSGAAAFSSTFNQKMLSYNATVNTGVFGPNQPFSNRNPYLALTHIICMSGVFPARP